MTTLDGPAADVTPEIDEPLAVSADLLASYAARTCRGGWAGADRCDWYHGSWQYLRLVDLVPTPRWHTGFYAARLRAATAAGGVRALVSGTADYAMYAHLLAADTGTPPASVTVVDPCPTALYACQWYAQHRGSTVRTLAADVRDLPEDEAGGYDLVCADAFLTRFGRDGAERVLRAWARVLRPGGVVVTTVRLAFPTGARTGAEAAASFREHAVRRWAQRPPGLRPGTAEIGDRAEDYARRMVSWPVGTAAELDTLFARWFTVLSAEVADVAGGVQPVSYLRAVLRKEGS